MSLSPEELSARYDLPAAITTAALSNIRNGISRFITISGKIGSGKDTVAPIVLDLLDVPNNQRGHDFFAKPLKEEINEVFYLIAMAADKDEAALYTCLKLGVPMEQAEETVNTLWDDVRNGVVETAYDRTPAVRRALQFWGTEVRRNQDDNYWVKKALKNVLTLVAEGKTVYVTDSRFPNEVASVADAGGIAIRINVSPEEQERRIKERDGIQISEDARNHVSETSLDNYEGFHVIVDTDNMTARKVAETIAEKVAVHDE